jgi:C4-dicarboxylate-specific signal transduction histidine kinase
MTTMFEQMLGHFEALSEAMGQMQQQMKTFVTKDDLARVETKLDTAIYAITETNKDVNDHDVRITRLEQAT